MSKETRSTSKSTTCYQCNESLLKTLAVLCSRCQMPYHDKCAEESGIMPNGAVRKCCDSTLILRKLEELQTSYNNNFANVDQRSKNNEKRIEVIEKSHDPVVNIENVIIEIQKRDKKRLNVVIFNMIDKNNLDADKVEIKSALQNAPFKNNSYKIVRIGTYEQNKNRPIKIYFKSSEHANWVLKNKNIFTKSISPNLIITNDRTKQ